MSEITIEYQRNIVGHPPASTVVTVERTDAVDALLAAGLVVDVDDPSLVDNHADGAVHPDPGPDDVMIGGVPMEDLSDVADDQPPPVVEDDAQHASVKKAARKATTRNARSGNS